MIGEEKVPMLIAQTGPAAGQRWALLKDRLTLGREPDCDIVLADRQVSRVHAILHRGPVGFELEDLNSKNGTHVNGRPVQGRVALQDGDLIQVALVARLAFVGSDATVPLPAGMTLPGPAPVAASPVADGLRLDSAARRVWIGEREAERSDRRGCE